LADGDDWAAGLPGSVKMRAFDEAPQTQHVLRAAAAPVDETLPDLGKVLPFSQDWCLKYGPRRAKSVPSAEGLARWISESVPNSMKVSEASSAKADWRAESGSGSLTSYKNLVT